MNIKLPLIYYLDNFQRWKATFSFDPPTVAKPSHLFFDITDETRRAQWSNDSKKLGPIFFFWNFFSQPVVLTAKIWQEFSRQKYLMVVFPTVHLAKKMLLYTCAPQNRASFLVKDTSSAGTCRLAKIAPYAVQFSCSSWIHFPSHSLFDEVVMQSVVNYQYYVCTKKEMLIMPFNFWHHKVCS